MKTVMTGRVDDTYPYLSVQVNHVIGLFVSFSLLCSSCLLRPTFNLLHTVKTIGGDGGVDCILYQLVRFHHM